MKNKMKKITKSIAVTIGLAIPSTTLAWNITNVTTATNQLKESLKTQNVNGLNITNPSPAKILDAVKKVGGKATVHTGNGKSINIDIQEKSAGGTVIVGSGANGLVATSNTSGNGGTVVISPPPMTTSITVATPILESELNSDEIFLIRIPDNLEETVFDIKKNEEYKTYLRNFRISTFKLNKPYRVTAGRYILLYFHNHFEENYNLPFNSLTFQKVEVKDGENQIFFLRKLELQINDDFLNSNASVYRKITSNDDKLLLKFLYHIGKIQDFQISSSNNLCKYLPGNDFKQNSNITRNNYFETNEFDLYLAKFFDITFQSKHMVYLFPGQYSIQWLIEDSCSVNNLNID